MAFYSVGRFDAAFGGQAGILLAVADGEGCPVLSYGFITLASRQSISQTAH